MSHEATREVPEIIQAREDPTGTPRGGEGSGSSSSGMTRWVQEVPWFVNFWWFCFLVILIKGFKALRKYFFFSRLLKQIQEVNNSWRNGETSAASGAASASDESREGAEVSTTSQASQERHETGSCEPCVFYSSKFGCRVGTRCRYCHLSHPEVRRRPGLRKNPRERIQERIRGHFNGCQDLPDLQEVLQAEAVRHSYAKIFIKECLDEMA